MALCVEAGSEPLPGYRLLARLGGGGFGEVWKAEADGGRTVAVKIVHGDLAAAAADPRSGYPAATQELHALRHVRTLRHPHLLAIDGYDVLDGRLVIVTALADGDLWGRYQLCRSHGLSGIPRDDLLQYLAEAAQGLDVLHEAGLQHLDVKPQNLFLVAGHVAVGDFGLVRDVRSGRPGAGATPVYAAPETFSGTLSGHCDQYSLAVVYQELLTGTRPFAGTAPQQLALQHLTAAPNLAPLPSGDRPAVARALSKKPGERFPSCTAFIEALRTRSERPDDPRPSRPSSVALRPAAPPPAVVIGVGGVGGAVLRHLRRALTDRLGPPDRWPHVRLLYVDTDPEDVRAAVDGGWLDPAEVLPARLQRAGHYSRQPRGDGKSTVSGWFDPTLLGRLSAAGTPKGCRGLGRLAFADHFRALSQKLEADLAAVARPTGSGRSHPTPGRPRVAVVAGLAGGTGGGMALDLAYLARHLLRRYGEDPAVSGWLLLPPVEGPAADTTAGDRLLANAYAALAELRHFAKPDTTYRARCDEDGSLASKDAPFADLVVLPLSDAGPALAAAGLVRDLLAPAARPAADAGTCRTFGQARFVWPRRTILRRAARQLAGELVTRWTTADTAAVAGAVKAWLAEQWTGLALGPEALSGRLQQAAAKAIGRPPEESFSALVGPVGGPPLPLRIEAVPGILTRADGLVGRLGDALAAATEGLVREWGTRLARLAVTLVEQPDFRLAGAEVGVRILADGIERSLAHFAPRADEWLRKADHAAAHGRALLAQRQAGAELAEAVRWAPRWRYQGLVTRQVAAVYAALRGQLADQLAEVGLCRTRLAAVLDGLRAATAVDPPAAELLLPAGCGTVEAAAARLATGPDDVRELDRRAQAHLQETAGGLARACLAGADGPRTLGPALVDLAEALLEPRLGSDGAAELFLARHPGDGAVAALAAAWSAAAPPLTGEPGAGEVAALAVPPGPAADQLVELARQAVGADVQVTAGVDEIALVREAAGRPVAGLPQAGPAAKAAYQRRKAAGDSPHARIDVLIGAD